MLLANLQEAGVDIHDLVIEPLMVPQSCQVFAPHVDAAACVLCTDLVTRPDCPSAAHLQMKHAYGMHGAAFYVIVVPQQRIGRCCNCHVCQGQEECLIPEAGPPCIDDSSSHEG